MSNLMEKTKELVLTYLLENEDVISLVIHPAACPTLKLPENLLQSPLVVLNVGLRNIFPPIPDLQIDENGVEGTLSFKGEPFHCHIPWTALVQLIVDNESVLWPVKSPLQPDEPLDSQKKSNRGHLRLVKD